jgi:hypothetical protein
MTPATLSVLSAVLVAIFLWRVWKSTPGRECELLANGEVEEGEFARCPREFVAALFRQEDWDFVSQFDSAPLKALFLSERKSLAIAWVRAIAALTRRIMREHTLASRSSSDLEIGTEVQIYSQYIALRAACVLLILAIEAAGPVRVASLSQRVHSMSEHWSAAHEALVAGNPGRKLQESGHA